MGASQSNARRLSIPNEDKTGVIKVSDSVVQRLKGGPTSNAMQEPINDVRIRPNQPTTQQPLVSNLPAASAGVQTSLQPQVPYYEPTLSSMQLLQEKEIELRKNDKYWEQRLAKLQENHRDVNRVLEEEYNKASREVTMRFASAPTKLMNPPCQELKSSILECYKSNPKNTLACSKIVQSFASCVDSSRVNVLEKVG